MIKNFEENLSKLNKSGAVNIMDSNVYPEPGQAAIVIVFADGTKLNANFWRMIKNNKAFMSSFDHQQKYGLPAPINAKEELRKELQDKQVIHAQIEKETGDLVFSFTGDLKLQVFNFTGYEVWEICFPDGTVEYSNYAK